MTAMKKRIAAGLVALSAAAFAAPALAHSSVGFSFHSGGVGVSVRSGEPLLVHSRRYYDDRYYEARPVRTYLTPRELRRILREDGYSKIRFVETEGRVWQALAVDYRGRRVLLTVSARSGEVLSWRRVRAV